ncbi:hypothetical protein V1478_018654 [Vespula squamosa]|uniref:Ribosomal protein S4 n=1 Tax=Vespula squamosa TaxID=30214 RepID=A0ABD1ZTE1_VESSQ
MNERENRGVEDLRSEIKGRKSKGLKKGDKKDGVRSTTAEAVWILCRTPLLYTNTRKRATTVGRPIPPSSFLRNNVLPFSYPEKIILWPPWGMRGREDKTLDKLQALVETERGVVYSHLSKVKATGPCVHKSVNPCKWQRPAREASNPSQKKGEEGDAGPFTESITLDRQTASKWDTRVLATREDKRSIVCKMIRRHHPYVNGVRVIDGVLIRQRSTILFRVTPGRRLILYSKISLLTQETKIYLAIVLHGNILSIRGIKNFTWDKNVIVVGGGKINDGTRHRSTPS